ncbi:MAG: anaerobic sulfatase maturase [Treponema sp.]|nr:anaerobic sulfatase maturase [Treponema sp.]
MQSHNFSLLVKPAGADCNLRCDYCFYREKSALYPKNTAHRMSDSVLQKLISSYMETDQNVYAFGWQGGEPTLMGIDFFRKIIRLQMQYGKPNATVSNALQTNGIFINDSMADLFTQYKFLLGISLDGPEAFHDVFRRTAGGGGSYRKVMKSIQCLRRKKTEFNILTLVSSANVKAPAEIYGYLKDEGFLYHQYIPCVEWDTEGKPQQWSITGEDWGRFLLGVFERWYLHDTQRISIRHFDSILYFLVHGEHNACYMGESCQQYFLVEYSGDIYPCDFFVRPDLKLGNIMQDSWQSFCESTVYHQFTTSKKKWDAACASCEFLSYCGGDCLKCRQGGISLGISALCEGWKLFYKETLPVFRKLAKQLVSESPKATLNV